MDNWDYWEDDLDPEPSSLWNKRRRVFRWIAIIVVIAMILALVVPAIVRVIRRPESPDRGTVTVLSDYPTSTVLPNLPSQFSTSS